MICEPMKYLQKNSAARIVTQDRLRDHDSMSRALMELHWLPVDKRIEYKLLLYTYEAWLGTRVTVTVTQGTGYSNDVYSLVEIR